MGPLHKAPHFNLGIRGGAKYGEGDQKNVYSRRVGAKLFESIGQNFSKTKIQT